MKGEVGDFEGENYMTINLTNPAVAFLFFGGFALWTLFCAWGCSDIELEWPGAFAVLVAGVAGLVALIALFVVVTNAL
jgi:hypothetical protein